jgi:hypothetical protein
MENNFYNDQFEQFLKESVDDFRMYPSKRVWNSLYNNLHPDRKWPSLATCLLIILTLTLFGVSNKQVVNTVATSGTSGVTESGISHKNNLATLINSKTSPASEISVKNTSVSETKKGTGNTKTIRGNYVRNNSIQGEQASKEKNNIIQSLVSRSSIPGNRDESMTNAADKVDLITSTLTGNNTNAEPSYVSIIDKNENRVSAMNESSLRSTFNQYELIPGKSITAGQKISKPFVRKKLLDVAEKEWIEDFAFHNKPKNKFKGRLAYEWYITPSIGYRNLKKNTGIKTPSTALSNPPGITGRSENYTIQHDPSWNLEAGGVFLLSVSKSFRLKAGLQLNYTRYTVHGAKMGHPGYSTLLLNNPSTGGVELVSRSSKVANIPEGTKGSKLNSSTYQVSIPIGADLKLAEINRFKWYAGATVQPGYVLAGNPYLISADMKNYIYDISLLRKWNVNTSFETFVTMNLKKNTVLSVGPQFRYQLFSTYTKRYTYDEKLYNLGMKVGFTRNF